MGELYENRLDRLYEQISRIYGVHEPHSIEGLDVKHRCPDCGRDHLAPGPEQVCGGANPTTMCDDLWDGAETAVNQWFPIDADLAQQLLVDTPEAWAWGFDYSDVGSVTEAVMSAFRYDARERTGLAAGVVPVDPRTTVSS